MSFNKKWGWIVVFLWVGLIFYFSSQPVTESYELSKWISVLINAFLDKLIPEAWFSVYFVHGFVRKLAHFFLFMVLGVLLMYSLSFSGIRSKKKKMFIVFGICVVLAILDEAHQAYVPGRGAQVSDVILDSLGALTGIGLWKLFENFR